MLTEELRAKILDLLPRYPHKQAVTLPALHIVQDALRCVPLPAIREIAELLDLSPAEVLDTMTFYGFFRTEENPLGRTRPPSFIHFATFPYLIEGHMVSDVVAVLGSLNIIAAELDR